MIILDTNVLSELMRPLPNVDVLAWMAAQPRPSLFTTTLTEAELRLGIELVSEGARRARLAVAVEGVFHEDLAGAVLPFDRAAARSYALIVAARRRSGRPISPIDAQVAAIAVSRGAAVATRNVVDFTGCGCEVINPWG